MKKTNIHEISLNVSKDLIICKLSLSKDSQFWELSVGPWYKGKKPSFGFDTNDRILLSGNDLKRFSDEITKNTETKPKDFKSLNLTFISNNPNLDFSICIANDTVSKNIPEYKNKFLYSISADIDSLNDKNLIDEKYYHITRKKIIASGAIRKEDLKEFVLKISESM